jgi:hypothetical protein
LLLDAGCVGGAVRQHKASRAQVRDDRDGTKGSLIHVMVCLRSDSAENQRVRRGTPVCAAAVKHTTRTLSGPPSTGAAIAMDGGVADTACYYTGR